MAQYITSYTHNYENSSPTIIHKRHNQSSAQAKRASANLCRLGGRGLGRLPWRGGRRGGGGGGWGSLGDDFSDLLLSLLLAPSLPRGPVSLPELSLPQLLLDARRADVVLALPLHALALADADAHTVTVVPLFTTVTADHEPAETMQVAIASVLHNGAAQSHQTGILPAITQGCNTHCET